MPILPRVTARRLHVWMLAALLTPLPLSPPPQAEGWTPVVPGVDVRLFSLAGPVRLHVARLDTREPSVIVESAVAAGGVSAGFETVSQMARRYDGGLIAWGGDWGRRGRVVVAINGSSYDPVTSEPYGGLFHSGSYGLRYGDLAGGTGFVWTHDRGALIRGCVDHPPQRQVVRVLSDGSTFELSAVNERRRRRGVLLFTPQFGPATPESSSETEVVVRVDRPVAPVAPPEMIEGEVVDLRRGDGQTPILFDEVVLAGRGRPATDFLRALRPGARVGISQEIADLGFGCRTPTEFDWSTVYSGIGGGFVFLRDGEIRHADERGASQKEPRTAVCLNDRHVYFLVADGRAPGVSVGMTYDEMAEFCRDELKATWGLNQDGGGSSTMWVNGAVVNSPSDGWERPIANGLLILAVEPAVRSTRFGEGFEVVLQLPAQVRHGPGEGQAFREIAPAGTSARILPAAESLQGAFATGSFWWKVEVAGVRGWMPEQALVTPNEALATFRLPRPRLTFPRP